ncbi:hypothetical protein PPERSA_10665 [Pseudocohnilembus persalinus]|uniref:Uncharacterized protein n=1 Tax=Pseudocohnilembus persalinus TaxID=266149 RepID=A0A0V0QDB7_PSEPJ|nr:hypothetical protein PPERSA_10665 [Pseudocohnilembus persalinus]|eukprot:KRX00166.1 hypothetical protein PPERSA_10665 [Pseudocohnilembus persalinus]
MKAFILLALLAFFSFGNCYQNDFSKKCQTAIDNAADQIVDIIHTFSDFNVLVFANDLRKLQTLQAKVNQECEGNSQWQIIIDEALAALTDDFKTCGGKVIVAIEDGIDLIEYLEKSNRNTLILIRKATQTWNAISDSIEVCKSKSEYQFDVQEFIQAL